MSLLDYMCGMCSQKKEKHSVVFTDGFGRVPHVNETALMQAVSQHPVVVAVCCGEFLDAWHAYTGGFLEVAGIHLCSWWCFCLCKAIAVLWFGKQVHLRAIVWRPQTIAGNNFKQLSGTHTSSNSRACQCDGCQTSLSYGAQVILGAAHRQETMQWWLWDTGLQQRGGSTGC